MNIIRYSASFVHLVKLTGMERCLLDYLTEVMDENNLILHNWKLREEFLEFMSHSKVAPVTDKHVKSMMSVLGKSVFLIPTKRKGEFYINPLYYAKSDRSRERLIVQLIQEGLLTRESK